MRLVTWNCRIGGFRRKAKHIALLRPDVLAVQEVEPIDNVLLFAGDYQPTYRDRMGDPAYPRRAIGMFSYTETELRAVDTVAPMYGFRRYEAHRGDLAFQVIGVWTTATRSVETSYRQAHVGLCQNRTWIGQRPTLILGDFNGNGSFKGKNWTELTNLATSLGLVSAYHEYFSERYGAETRQTHFHHGKEAHGFHLDYCFLPKAWMEHVTKVDVGTCGDWQGLSDHVPLIVDLDI
jgi:endonuclease/exonuclease/phosphatase family metal-dependent hydrolase